MSLLQSQQQSREYVARNVRTSESDEGRELGRGREGDGYLNAEDGRDHDDEKNSYAHGDPDADNVALTSLNSVTTTRNQRSRSNSSRTYQNTRAPSASSRYRSSHKRSGSGSSHTQRMEMRERGAPTVTLPASVTSNDTGNTFNGRSTRL